MKLSVWGLGSNLYLALGLNYDFFAHFLPLLIQRRHTEQKNLLRSKKSCFLPCFFYFWVASKDRSDPLRFLVNNSSIDFQQKKKLYMFTCYRVYSSNFQLSLGEKKIKKIIHNLYNTISQVICNGYALSKYLARITRITMLL
jgi:hypothetical protein